MNHDEVKLKVWIDQDLCTGDGLCEEICPSVFGMAQDGLAYVKEPDWPTVYNDGKNVYEDPILQMATGMATCLLYTSPSPRDRQKSRMPSSA